MQDSLFIDTRNRFALDPQTWKWLLGILNGAGFAIGLWVLVWPRPYRLAVLSAMAAFVTALAVKMYSHQGLDITDAKRGVSRPGIPALFLVPALALAARSLQDFNVLDWKPILMWSAALAAMLAVPLLAGDKEVPKRPLTTAFLLIVTYAYAWGAIAETNFMFDSSAPSSFPTMVQSMHVSRGKSTSYHLRLDSWHGRPAGDDIQVPYVFYARHRPGDTICVILRNGWLGFRYYKADACW